MIGRHRFAPISFTVVILFVVLGAGSVFGAEDSERSASDTDADVSSSSTPPTPDAAVEAADARRGSRGTLIASITIFVLAVFVGFEVITKVPPTLHTPLMSGSNAISGITLVGALLAAGARQTDLAAVIGTLAVIMASINAVGGFLVTHRMLAMFRRK